MRSHKFMAMVLGGSLLAACAGGAARQTGSAPVPAPSTPPSDIQSGGAAESPAAPEAEESATSNAQPGFGQPAAEAPTAAPKSAARGRSFESQPLTRDERPGLGTSWGETRESHVSSEAFVRANGNRPVAVASVFYNDAEGVRAMARRAGISDFGAGRVNVFGGAITVRLLDARGEPLPALDIGGRTHFVGEDGDRYMLQVQNHTANRVEAVATVDGLDVIDGRAGSFSKRGYLIAPFASIEIEGFRRSNDEVAAFRFGSVRDSYAARKGNDRNVGVIGVAFFQEAGTRFPWTNSEVDRRNSADPFPGQFATPPRGFE